MLEKKQLLTQHLSGAYDLLDGVKNEMGREVNPILNNIVLPILGWVLLVGGIISVLWSFGQLKQGNAAKLGLGAGILSMIGGSVALGYTVNIFG